MLSCPLVSPHRNLRIVIAAEQALFRDGLRSLFEAEFPSCTVLEADDASDVLGEPELQSDLLVLDLASAHFPGGDLLLETTAKVRIVVLWDERHQAVPEGLLRLGVWRVVDKRLGAPALLDAVGSALFGVERPPRAVERRRFGLTKREGQVLAAVASALPNKEIAYRLAITEDTVKRHLTSIFNKLGVSNRVELTLFAVHHCLIDGSIVPERPAVPLKAPRPPRRLVPWRERLVGTR